MVTKRNTKFKHFEGLYCFHFLDHSRSIKIVSDLYFQTELGQLEQTMIEAKRSRDRTLTRMKKQAEKQKEMAEKIDRRARATLQTDDSSQGNKKLHRDINE